MPRKFKPDIDIRSSDLGEGTSFASYSKIGEPLMASFLDRFVAYAIDSVILSVILTVFTFLIFFIASIAIQISYGSGVFKNLTNPLFSIMFVISILLDILIGLFYYIYFNRTSGQTPGKMVMNIKVVDKKELQNLGIGKIILRETIGRFVSASFCFLGYFWYFYNNKRQTWHDIIACSIVVSLTEDGDINMQGRDEYEKNPLKTFVAPMLILLSFFILALLILTVIEFAANAGFLYEFYRICGQALNTGNLTTYR